MLIPTNSMRAFPTSMHSLAAAFLVLATSCGTNDDSSRAIGDAGDRVDALKVCTPGSFTCSMDNLKQCDPTGSGYEWVSKCEPGLCEVTREAGQPQCVKCVPSSVTCEGNSLHVCSDDGMELSVDACGDLYCDRFAAGCTELAITNLVTLPAPDGTTFQIDSTEVTQRQYGQYLASIGSAEFPSCEAQTIGADHPMTCVTWFEAEAYCQWAGKRLCDIRPFGGGEWAEKDEEDPRNSEWTNACTGGTSPLDWGWRAYGWDHIADCDREWCSTAEVRTRPQCSSAVSPYDQLFGLSNETSEWLGSRGWVGDLRGFAPYQAGRCQTNGSRDGNTRNCDIGFRCCGLP
jgi:hypothetical protein